MGADDGGSGVEGVMVSYHHSGPEGHAGIVTVSASGIKFGRRWVLTHGSLLSPLPAARDVHRSRGRPMLNDRWYASLPEMYITCDVDTGPAHGSHAALARLRGEHADHAAYHTRVLTGRVVHAWQCPVLDRCVDDILYSWTIGHRDADMDDQRALGKTLLSVFVLIDLEENVQSERGVLRPLSELLDVVRPPPGRGAPLHVHSTPFGCEAFLNSATEGRVCGVVGARPSLLLTDASTALGSEGAPVYAARDLVGMVVCSVAWWRGEWVGLTLVAPLKAALDTKLRTAAPPPPPPERPRSPPRLARALRSIDASVVLVRCGETWGSGVCVARGRVVTCAHVVKEHGRHAVSVWCGGASAKAHVRYKTRDEQAYDLALLETDETTLPDVRPARLASKPPNKGDPVVAAGYPYFSERHVPRLEPTVTSGHVSNASPSMLQTSCCVQSGFSGGGIFRLLPEGNSEGVELCGVIVSNAKTQQSAACFPYINMAVPVHAFAEPLARFLHRGDMADLRKLETKVDPVQAQWRLLPYRSKI